MTNGIERVLVTGGAGYVGSMLVPKLLNAGYEVVVYDTYYFGLESLAAYKDNPKLRQIQADIRDVVQLQEALRGVDAVIHLACISNDPSFELNPELGRSINYDAFGPLVRMSHGLGVRRFIYASSSSVYGVKLDANVTEDLELEPLTDYSKYKALCETLLLEERERKRDFAVLILRPATVCGYSTRMRLDLTVNILTNDAIHNRKIKVFGGNQMRPNIHIKDMTDLYLKSLEWPAKLIDGKVYNAGYHNLRVLEIAEKVKKIVGQDVEILKEPTKDNRSYHISSEKIKRDLGFVPSHSVDDAIHDLVCATEAGKLPGAMTDIRYSNIKMMQHLKVQ